MANTRHLTRAIKVQFALLLALYQHRCLAPREWVTFGQVFGAHAAGCVVLRVADGVLGARWVGHGGARVDAVLLDTGAVCGALRVRVAFGAFAALEGVAVVAGWAATRGAVVGAVALGVCRARVA